MDYSMSIYNLICKKLELASVQRITICGFTTWFTKNYNLEVVGYFFKSL